MLDEYYEAGDDRFLDEVLASHSPKKLKSLGARWYADSRPFARRALLRYIDDGCDRSNHRPLVKALFKAAEKAGDDEAMGHFLAAFDRLARRELRKLTRYDWNTRQTYDEYALVADQSVPGHAPRERGRPWANEPPPKTPEGYPVYRAIPRFSLATRRYMQRRCWRYFRKLGHKDLARYASAIRATLALYQDENLSKPERLVDAWGLMHALYWGASLRTRKGSPPGSAHQPGMPAVLRRVPKGIEVADGRTLTELVPAPYLPDAWKGCATEVLDLFIGAKSRTVRSFSKALLQRDYPDELKGLPMARVRSMLRSPHPDVQLFGAELLRTATGLEKLPLSEWMELLKLDNAEAIPIVCEAVAKNVTPDRLTLAQCVELCCARPASVAELGLEWAKKKPVRTEADLAALVPMAKAHAPRVREAAVDWLCQLLLVNDKEARPELVRELLDSSFDDVRRRALSLMEKDDRFKESTLLWTALAESPYPDIRQYLVLELEKREKLYAPETLRHVWASALLAVHRGGRAKRAVANQIAVRITRRPDEVDSLLPLLGYALRSVRPPERRAALASLAKAAFAAPALQSAIAKQLPELKLIGDEVSR